MGLVEECGSGCITIAAWLNNGAFRNGGGKGVCGRRRVEKEKKVPQSTDLNCCSGKDWSVVSHLRLDETIR